MRKKANGIAFILFYAIFGYAYSFDDMRLDIYRKMLIFQSWPEHYTTKEVFQDFIMGNTSEIYEQLLNTWIRQLTDNAHILFMVVGLVAGSFICLSIRKMLKHIPLRNQEKIYIVLTVVLFLSPVSIGGIRFLTAASIFLYSSLVILLDRKWYGIIGACICPLIHFSHTILIPFLFIVFLLQNSQKTKFLIFILTVTCLLSAIMGMSGIQSAISSIDFGKDSTLGYKATAYSSEDSISLYSKSLTTILLKVQRYLTRAYILLFAFIAWKLIEKRKKYFNLKLLNITILFLILGCFFMEFSVVGDRYLVFGQCLLPFFLVSKASTSKSIETTRLIKISPFFYVFSIGWVLFNTYIGVNSNFFYLPFPIFLAQ
ncbi:EpsG family protein [Porphyromonas gulae]|uniref:EpsG family protein n=1 Tax=Porphyromonas gulae TaxID=111105 RepID=UPI0013769AC3|nr:EpsG family protein [Porphyromonas gulae]